MNYDYTGITHIYSVNGHYLSTHYLKKIIYNGMLIYGIK